MIILKDQLMKSFKLIALSIFATLSLFCAVLYTSSCSKDGCKGVTCLNGGSCGGGVCSCTIPGTGGTNCEIIYSRIYAFTYKGNAVESGIDDTTNIDINFVNNSLVFSGGNDTANYNSMTLIWQDDSGKQVLSMPITLANNSPTGSTFTVTANTIIKGTDTSIYSGSGSVNGTTASLTLTRVHPTIPSNLVITFSNFVKQ